MNEVAKRVNEGLFHIWDWILNNQAWSDAIAGVVAAGIVVFLFGRTQRMRRRLHRKYWMLVMKRKDRELYQRMKFEDAIGDATLQMLCDGEMTEQEAKEAYRLFAVKMGFTGLVPKRDKKSIKKAINGRLKGVFYRKKPRIPGPMPGVEKVDASYDPSVPETGLSKSKYFKAA